MQLTRIAITCFGPAEPITISCYPTIHRSPKNHAARKIHHRRSPPQSTKSTRQITDCLWPPVPIAMAIDKAHFLHQTVRRHLRPTFGHFGVVERKVAQLLLAIPPRQFADLGRTYPAIAIEDHHIGIGPIGGAGEGRKFRHGSNFVSKIQVSRRRQPAVCSQQGKQAKTPTSAYAIVKLCFWRDSHSLNR